MSSLAEERPQVKQGSAWSGTSLTPPLSLTDRARRLSEETQAAIAAEVRHREEEKRDRDVTDFCRLLIERLFSDGQDWTEEEAQPYLDMEPPTGLTYVLEGLHFRYLPARGYYNSELQVYLPCPACGQALYHQEIKALSYQSGGLLDLADFLAATEGKEFACSHCTADDIAEWGA